MSNTQSNLPSIELEKIEFVVQSTKHDKPIALDITFSPTEEKLTPVIFAHRLKEFKDWGAHNKIAEVFAQRGFAFIKFNFSHNGTSVEKPTDFVDLEAFKKNTISTELDDIEDVISFLFSEENTIASQLNMNKLSAIGHCRGGGIVLIKSKEDERIRKVITWAATDGFLSRYREDTLEHWKEDGVLDVWNARTKRHMPIGYQFVEDYQQNKSRFDIPKAVEMLHQPLFLIHGAEDTTVKVEAVHKLYRKNPNAKLSIIDSGDHTFGQYHPYEQEELPEELQEVVDKTIKFLKKN